MEYFTINTFFRGMHQSENVIYTKGALTPNCARFQPIYAAEGAMRRASDEQDITAFRSDRFFVSEGQWFFATREQVDFGPFRDRPDAYRAVLRYLDTQATMARLRGGDSVPDPDETFNKHGVANIAKQIRTWSNREVGTIRGDEQRRDTELDND